MVKSLIIFINIKGYFQDLLGKIYAPFEDKKKFLLALEKPENIMNYKKKIENNPLLITLKPKFTVNKYKIGENP